MVVASTAAKVAFAAAVLAAWLVAGRHPAATDALTHFWTPMLASSSQLLLCIGDPSQSAERIGGGDLGRQNVQILVDAAVMGEDSGAPRVIAVHSW